MAFMATPGSERARDTRKRLESCWELDISWDKYPSFLREVRYHVSLSVAIWTTMCLEAKLFESS